MSPEELVAALEALDFDSEAMHSQADHLVIDWMAGSKTAALRNIAAAYRGVQDRADFWASA